MSQAAHPTSFDIELDSERGRWLRRRFLWFCVINTLISVPFLPSAARTMLNTTGSEQRAAIVLQGSFFLGLLMIAAAFVYAWKSPPNRRQILRLAVWLSCVTGILFLVTLRIAVAIDPRGALGFDVDTTPSTTGPPRMTPETVAMFFSIYLVLMGHVLPCVLIPWNLRESLPLAASLLGTFLAIVAIDAAAGKIDHWFVGGGVILTLLLLLPGLEFCWRRDRRFRKQFKLQYESRGYQKLQHELADARRVHESCLPQQITAGPLRLHYVYEPMRQIGGDLLFVAARDGDESTLSTVLLDVTGHGIAAALTVNRIVGELQRIFGENRDASPGQVLAALNRYVCVTLSQHNLYMTAICIRADATRNVLEYANGGHPSAFLRRHDGSIQMLESTTMLLGLMSDGFSAEPIELPFNPGDALLAYTDGAAEAKNDRNAMLGMAGVQRILERIAADDHAPADWPGGILRRVLDYRGAPPDDDTLVAAVFRPLG